MLLEQVNDETPTHEVKQRLVKELFTDTEQAPASLGHQMAAAAVQRLIKAAEVYYRAWAEQKEQFEIRDKEEAPMMTNHTELAALINHRLSPNYPPTAFLVNAFLPPQNQNREYSYVATLHFLHPKPKGD